MGIRCEINEQGSRDGGTLLLAAGKRVWIMVSAMVKLKSLKELRDSGVQLRLVDVMESSKDGKEDVFFRRQRRNQVEGLEDDTDVLSSEQCQLMVVERGEICAVDEDVAGRRLRKSRNEMEKSGLAGATGAHDNEKLALRDVKRQIINCGDWLGTVAVEDFTEIFDADVWFHVFVEMWLAVKYISYIIVSQSEKANNSLEVLEVLDILEVLEVWDCVQTFCTFASLCLCV